MCFRSLRKTPVGCVLRAPEHILFSVVVVPVGSTRNAVVSLALWSLMSASGVNGVLDRPDQDSRPMTEVILGGEKLEIVPSFSYLRDFLSSGGSCGLPIFTSCHVALVQIQRAPARPHLPLISYHLQRMRLQFVRQECHILCTRNLSPNHIWLASPAVQWPSYDLLDVRCHHQGPSQIAGSLGEDAAWRSGKGTQHPLIRWHSHVECSNNWLKKVQKLNSTGCRGRGHPKKTWTEVIDMDCLALGLAETHPSDWRVWIGRLRGDVRLDPPLY